MIKKLKYRFIWINLSILLGIFLAIFSGTYYLMYQSGKTQAIKIMEQIAQNEGSIFKSPPNGPKKDHFSIDTLLMRDSFTIVFDYNSNSFKLNSNMPEETDLSHTEQLIQTVLSFNEQTGTTTFNGLNLRYLKQLHPNGNLVFVFLDRTTELSTLSQLSVVLLGIGSITIIVLAGISYFLACWAIKPTALAWEKQQQFVADASHELKTPLSVIQTTTDVLLSNKEKTIASEQKWVDYIKSETERMSKLVSDLLYLAKVDSNEVLITSTPFNLSEAIINITLPFESIVFESNKELQMEIEPDLMYIGEEARLQQVAIILLDNALKHAPIKSSIQIRLHQVGTNYQLEVSNEGEGIPPQHLDKVFERFYRVDASRARDTGGYGLGLSIAKSIVEQHHGSISVKSQFNELTTFTVTLPIKQNHHLFKR